MLIDRPIKLSVSSVYLHNKQHVSAQWIKLTSDAARFTLLCGG